MDSRSEREWKAVTRCLIMISCICGWQFMTSVARADELDIDDLGLAAEQWVITSWQYAMQNTTTNPDVIMIPRSGVRCFKFANLSFYDASQLPMANALADESHINRNTHACGDLAVRSVGDYSSVEYRPMTADHQPGLGGMGASVQTYYNGVLKNTYYSHASAGVSVDAADTGYSVNGSSPTNPVCDGPQGDSVLRLDVETGLILNQSRIIIADTAAIETNTTTHYQSENPTFIIHTPATGASQAYSAPVQPQPKSLPSGVPAAEGNPKQISNAGQIITPAKTISAVVPSRTAFESSNLVLANIGSLPEPFTVILLALGSITLFNRTRRKTRKIKATIKNFLF